MARPISLEPGMPAPEFGGTALGGRAIALADLGPGPVLLEFFRGTW